MTILVTVPSYSATVIAAIGDYPPYTSTNDPYARLAEELVVASYRAVGDEVRIRRVPWKRAYEEVKSGRVDITFPWIKTAEREKDFMFSRKLLVTQEVFLYHKDSNFTWSTLEDLKAYSIGATQGYAHVQLMSNAGIDIQIALNDSLNLTKLLKHRIDAFPIGAKVANYLLAESSSELKNKISSHNKPLFTNNNYVLSSKQNPQRATEVLEKFNRGLSKIKRNGLYDKIIDKYK